MLKTSTTLLFCILMHIGFSQLVSDEVETGEQYQNQIWYNMESGIVGSAPLNNWDLAFEISGFTASIRANTQKGITVYQAPFASAEWNQIDTAGMGANWEKLYNNISAWEEGALNRFSTSDFDLGWGMYNVVTHVITGDSVQVIQLADGSFKKFKMETLASGVYTFTYADLDGSNETTGALDKANFEGKNFGYFNLETGEVVDREPLSADWDISFTKYTGSVNGIPYPVAGVMHNYDVRTAEVTDTPIDEADPWAEGFSDAINTIGYDWKNFDFSTGWQLTEDLSFFVEALNGNVYQLVFTDFSGSGTGIYTFGTEMYSALSTAEEEKNPFTLYPNPVHSGNLNIKGQFSPNSRIEIFDLSGRLLKASSINAGTTAQVNIDAFRAGTYVVRIFSNNANTSNKINIIK